MVFRMKRGFTLIELLVVIAIIAILAAILFPVFAQARAKARQTTCLSNYKQQSLSFTQYSQDYDERMPQAMPLANFGSGPQWTYGYQLPVPANLYGDPPADQALYQTGWANSIQPYAKNLQILDCPSVSDFDLDPTTQTVIKAPRIAMTFNGMLTSYPQSGIVASSSAILLWTGMAREGLIKGFETQPQLVCNDATAPCVYKPTAGITDSSLCPTGNGATSKGYIFSQPSKVDYTIWIHGQGDNYCFVDGHAKWRPLPATTKSDGRVNPYVAVSSTGDPTINGFYVWGDYCSHHYLFRPDYQP